MCVTLLVAATFSTSSRVMSRMKPAGTRLRRATASSVHVNALAVSDAAGAAGAAGGRSSDHATGPDASRAAARHGLCQAWASGQGDDHGRRADAPAFQALADAAGGADQVAAYCATETSNSADHGQRPAAPPGGGGEHGKASPPTGPPADPGDGHGQGRPPTTA